MFNYYMKKLNKICLAEKNQTDDCKFNAINSI